MHWFLNHDGDLTSDAALALEVETPGPEFNHVIVPANETLMARVYVTAEPQDPAASEEVTPLTIWIEEVGTEARAGTRTIFNGRN
ncbi:MAG: hypothetical protein AAGF79_17300 [Pseudomonadota bacterium]